MSLKKKLNIISFIFTLLTIGIVSFILTLSSGRSFFMLEEQAYKDGLDSMLKNIEKEFSDIEYILKDWAKWDDTYNFARGLEPNYVEDNMGENILEDLSLNYFFVYNESGDLIYGMKRDSDTNELFSPNQMELYLFSQSDEKSGVLNIEDQYVVYSSAIITDSDEEDSAGTMIFGRVANDDLVSDLEERLSMSLDVSTYEDDSLGETSALINYDKYGLVGVVEHNRNELSYLKVFIPIDNSAYYILISTEKQNKIMKMGNQYIFSVIGMIAGILAMFGVILHWLFGKVVINRLIELNNQIGTIRDNKDSSQRLDHSGVDEVGELSSSINHMLEELESIHLELSHFASYDAMTGVYNRRIGLDILDEAIRNVHIHDIPLSIVYLDIDGLKTVNDRFGHAVGDQMIKDAIQILTSGVDTKSIVRLGGDEFLLILRNKSLIEAKEIEEKIIHDVVEYNKATKNLFSMSFSMGVVQFSKELSLDEFLERADEIMYEKKQKKKLL